MLFCLGDALNGRTYALTYLPTHLPPCLPTHQPDPAPASNIGTDHRHSSKHVKKKDKTRSAPFPLSTKWTTGTQSVPFSDRL